MEHDMEPQLEPVGDTVTVSELLADPVELTLGEALTEALPDALTDVDSVIEDVTEMVGVALPDKSSSHA